jgi:hypothetical protein
VMCIKTSATVLLILLFVMCIKTSATVLLILLLFEQDGECFLHLNVSSD